MQDFQLVSLKLLAEQLLLGCPTYSHQRSLPLYVPGEATRARLVFLDPPVIYASPNNPGAAEIAARFKASMTGLEVTDRAERAHHATFLLYLNDKTFSGDEGEALAVELRTARAAGTHVLMVHENDPNAGGCKVGRNALAQPTASLLTGACCHGAVRGVV